MSSDPQSFLVVKEKEDDDENDAKFKVLSKHTSQHPDGLQGIAPQCSDSADENYKDKKFIKEDECVETISVPSTESEKPSLGQPETPDNNDGFRTPTSPDHKIPVITECPPAPKKTRPNPSAKRKASPTIRRNIQPDLSRELELLFPQRTLQNDIAITKIKKARADDSD